MAILGLILLLAAGGLTLDVVVKNTSNINVNAVGQTFTLSPGWLFVAGVVAGAVGLLGVTMILGSVARAHRRPVVLAEARGTARDLEVERDQLAGDLYHERAARTPTPDDVDVRQAAPATVEPAVAVPAATSVMTSSDGNEPASSHGHGLLHRRHHDDRPVDTSTTASSVPVSTVAPDDLG